MCMRCWVLPMCLQQQEGMVHGLEKLRHAQVRGLAGGGPQLQPILQGRGSSLHGKTALNADAGLGFFEL